MRIAVFTGLVALLLATMPVAAAERTVAEIGRCMAFFAVVSGMDGTGEVEAGTAIAIRELGAALYEAGEREGAREEELQNAVVGELVKLNLRVREEGLDAVRTGLAEGCEGIVDAMRGLP